MKHTMLMLAVAVIVAAPVLAFHDAGVAHCNGCHTMHNSQNGGSVAFDANGVPLEVTTGNNFLLYYASPTDTCLNCHYGSGSYHVWEEDNLDGAAGYDEKGAGDFSYSTAAQIVENTHDDFYPMDGEGAGHTLVSYIGGRPLPDQTLTEAPGDISSGSPYQSAALRCTSCHDPHGNDSFRFLYRTGQISDFGTVNQRIWATTLDASGIGMFGPSESNSNHNGYNNFYAEWCATCHPDIHDNGDKIHPTGATMSTRVQNVYNMYTGSTDCVGVPAPCGDGSVDSTNSYLALVPFEDPAITLTSTAGPGANSRVTCVTCHRAHGTSAPDGGRWDFNVTALVEDGTVSGTYALPNPYDAGQRSLCNKCHAKDEYDAPWS